MIEPVQTVWKGTIAFGLVSIGVRLVSATEERDVTFRQVRQRDGSRIRYRRVAEVDGEEVSYADIAKGYELPDGDMVVLTDDDLSDLPVPTTKTIEVLEFVDAERVEPTGMLKPYYALPLGEPKPYALLLRALQDSARIAVVKIALRGRERLAVLRAEGGLLTVQTMLWPDEIRHLSVPEEVTSVQIRPQELTMAQSYIEAMVGDFDPAAYTDRYREAIEAAVQAKVDGHEITAPPATEGGSAEVVDLLEALRRSVDAAKSRQAHG